MFCAQSFCLAHTIFKEVINVLLAPSTFALPAGWTGLEKICLIRRSLQSSVISLFLKAGPLSVSIAFVTP